MRFLKIDLHPDYSAAGAVKTDTFQPELDAYLLDDARHQGKRRAVIICPGGGYAHTAAHEGEPVAMRYLAGGIQAFVLWYSVKPAVFPMALMELAESVRLIREHAEEWNIDPEKIAVSGFSAGGHLAASLCVLWNKLPLEKWLHTEKTRIRPDAGILCYPVITSGEKAHRGSFNNLLDGLPKDEYLELCSLEKQVDVSTPPAFLWHTWNDNGVPVENSIYYMMALREHGIGCEVHLFADGVHGISLATEEVGNVNVPCQPWIDLAITWLRNL